MPSKRSKRSSDGDVPFAATSRGARPEGDVQEMREGDMHEMREGDMHPMREDDRPAETARSSGLSDEFNRLVENQLSQGREKLRAVADAIGETADRLQDGSPRLAGMVRTASERVSEFSDRVEKRSFRELLDDATTFGRRQPAVFFAGAIAAGFLASRFLKSSASRSAIEEDVEPIAGEARHAGP